MRALLDTHTFLWAIAEPERLSRRVVSLLTGPREDELVISTVSLWEIVLKHQKGRLDLPVSRDFFEAQFEALGISRIQPVEASHLYRLTVLPLHHKDPFDRLLIAQCQVDKLTLVSRDEEFRKYDIELFW